MLKLTKVQAAVFVLCFTDALEGASAPGMARRAAALVLDGCDRKHQGSTNAGAAVSAVPVCTDVSQQLYCCYCLMPSLHNETRTESQRGQEQEERDPFVEEKKTKYNSSRERRGENTGGGSAEGVAGFTATLGLSLNTMYSRLRTYNYIKMRRYRYACRSESQSQNIPLSSCSEPPDWFVSIHYDCRNKHPVRLLL
ncbi:hypothetical protein JOB18_044255 [Solea senegalensis]|uniref:Secreted protein n=1 Tax=Solea senegalensis TaxID=28829 RepID=A0AAV6R775_SOLSE|nr:hypothetical protein JOB18_044255 [Solea senegalensis]